jgi:hypothetical protein
VPESLLIDINGDGLINLSDAVLTLQVLTGTDVAGILGQAGVNIRMEKTICILHWCAELR